MSSDEPFESGSVQLPVNSDEEQSDESYVNDVQDNSDDESLDDTEPIFDQKWRFISDPFTDTCPDPIPLFSDTSTGISAHVRLLYLFIYYYILYELIDTFVSE